MTIHLIGNMMMTKIRNPLIFNPLLKKGHFHENETKQKKLEKECLLEELRFNKPLLNPREYIEENGNV